MALRGSWPRVQVLVLGHGAGAVDLWPGTAQVQL